MCELSCAILYEQMSQQKFQPRYATLLLVGCNMCRRVKKYKRRVRKGFRLDHQPSANCKGYMIIN